MGKALQMSFPAGGNDDIKSLPGLVEGLEVGQFSFEVLGRRDQKCDIFAHQTAEEIGALRGSEDGIICLESG